MKGDAWARWKGDWLTMKMLYASLPGMPEKCSSCTMPDAADPVMPTMAIARRHCRTARIPE